MLDTIKQVQNAPFEGSVFVQEKALKFCKQQELQKVMNKAQKIIDQGDFESYDTVEGLVRTALQVGIRDGGVQDIFSGMDEVLNDLRVCVYRWLLYCLSRFSGTLRG